MEKMTKKQLAEQFYKNLMNGDFNDIDDFIEEFEKTFYFYVLVPMEEMIIM